MNLKRICALAGATALLVTAGTALASAAPPPTPFVKKNPVLTVTYNDGTTVAKPGVTPGALSCTTGKWSKAAGLTYTIRVVRDSSTTVATFNGVAKGASVSYDIKEGDAALAAQNLDDGSDLGRVLKCIVNPTGYTDQRGFTKTIKVQKGGNAGSTPTVPEEFGAPTKVTDSTSHAVTVTGLANEYSGAVVGWELRCNEGTWDPAAPSGVAAKNFWSYSWTRNGSPILDALGKPVATKQLLLTAADAGANIGCNVAQTRNGYGSGFVQSANLMKVAGSPPPSGGGSSEGAPSVSGANPSITFGGNAVDKVMAGQVLKCLPGDWKAPTGYTLMDQHFSFAWVLDSSEVLPNTMSEESFTVPADLDAGDKITCLVTAQAKKNSDNSIVKSSPVTTNPVEFKVS